MKKIWVGVVIILILLVAALLWSVGITEAPVDVSPEDTVMEVGQAMLSVGESESFNIFSIRLDGIEEDSRCPANVNCIQAGRVVASTTLSLQGIEESLLVSSEEPSSFNGYVVSIASVTPSVALEGEEVVPDDYKITFDIEKEFKDFVAWNKAVELIHAGQVEMAAIYHSGEANLLIEEGMNVSTLPPSESVFYSVIEACGRPCSDMAIATE